MGSNEQVAKALEAACRTDPLYGATPGADADIQRDRAEAVAAFLRAMPIDCEIDADWRVHRSEFDAIAAAVEAAAGEK